MRLTTCVAQIGDTRNWYKILIKDCERERPQGWDRWWQQGNIKMKNASFLVVTLYGSCKNWRFRGNYRLHNQGDWNRWARNTMTVFLCSVIWLLVTANGVPSSLIPVTLMIEAIRSSETLVPIKPHGITSQKTAFFIVTAMKTSNLTLKCVIKRYGVWVSSVLNWFRIEISGKLLWTWYWIFFSFHKEWKCLE
jgi:hypothetical protein